MSQPKEQQAIFITAPGGPEVLRMGPAAIENPGDDEVLIQVLAAGVNRHDCHQRRRGPVPTQSDVPGLEVAGVVVAVGRRVKSLVVGARVCALTDGGGYAHFAIAKASLVLPIPADLPWTHAAALPEAAFTTWHNFFGVAAMGPGETVLIHGGTSGVGTFAIQLLCALGHPVFVTCGSVEKMDAALLLGANAAFNYREGRIVEGVRDATGGRGVDVILDMSGARHSASDVEALAFGGRLVHLSPGETGAFTAPLRTILMKQLKVSGSALRPLPVEAKSVIARRLAQVVWPLIDSGRITPVIHKTFALREAASSHAEMERGEHIGKFVLTTT